MFESTPGSDDKRIKGLKGYQNMYDWDISDRLANFGVKGQTMESAASSSSLLLTPTSLF